MAALVDVTWAEVQTLQRAGDAVDHDIQSKFAGSIEAAYSGLSTFFGGLEGVIGGPSPKVHEAMEREHTQGGDWHKQFTTENYGVTTTSAIEFKFVAKPDSQVEWPVEDKLVLHVDRGVHADHQRWDGVHASRRGPRRSARHANPLQATTHPAARAERPPRRAPGSSTRVPVPSAAGAA